MDTNKLTKQQIHDVLLSLYGWEIADIEGSQWTKQEGLDYLNAQIECELDYNRID